MNKHWQVKANDADIEKYERLFIFKQIKGQWKEDGGSQFAKNHRKTYLKMKEWMKGSETTK
jgi:hypothetical protein